MIPFGILMKIVLVMNRINEKHLARWGQVFFFVILVLKLNTMLTEKEMLEIARKYMKRQNRNENYDLVITLVENKQYGNIYYFQTREYLETRNTDHALTNGYPFLVENTKRRVVQFGWPIEERIKQYENGTMVPTLHTFWYPDEDRFSHE